MTAIRETPRPTTAAAPARHAAVRVAARRAPAVALVVALAVTFTALMAAAPPAFAAPGGLPTNVGHADSSPQWDKVRAALFKDRAIVTDRSRTQVHVPLRAAFGATVPVKVTAALPQREQLHAKRLYLVIDKNPSPIAAVLELTTELGQADFETRLRVDEYSHVRAITEWSDGQLHMDSRYVKVSGGCSAPPNRDQLHNIGKTAFRLPEGVKPGQPTPADVSVVHPNDTGFELNNVTVMFIPPHFVRQLKVTFAGRRLFDADLDFSISENPSFRFNFVPRSDGELKAEVEDSKEQRYVGRLAVRAGD